MKAKLEIQAVMTPFPHSVGINQPLDIAKKLMLDHGVRHLPVQDGGQLVGVVSDRDINFALAVDKKTASQETVAEVCTLEPYVVEPTAAVDQVARRMANDHIGCAIVTQGSKLVGIFTTVDACRTLAEALTGKYKSNIG